MKLVLFTTDVSAFRLIERPDMVVIPANRQYSPKVYRLVDYCFDNRIPFCWHNKLHSDWFFILKKIEPTFGISWLYSQILPQAVIDLFSSLIINFHGDTGIKCVGNYYNSTLRAACEREDTASIRLIWHKLIAEVDAGEVFIEGTIPITDYADTRKRMIDTGIEMFKEIQGQLFEILEFFA